MLTWLSLLACTLSCSRGVVRPALAPSRCLTMVLRCIPVMPWYAMSEPDYATAHPAGWWVRPQLQQDLLLMVGLKGACEVDGIAVVCWQWARGAAGPAPLVHVWLSPGHSYSLPVTQLPVPQPQLGISVQAIH